jgi:hypothetical protein
LNTIYFQYNVQNNSTFIFYTTFSKLIFVNDLKNSTIVLKQDIVKLFCKIDNKRINVLFSNVFYVFKWFFNLINFDQLNNLCLIIYKFNIFNVENQNIITKKRVNNVFFINCENMWIIIFIVTFIVYNFAMSFDESKLAINKNILNVWHVRLKHLKKQNVGRFVKMSKKINLIKFISNKNFCESCIVIKQKIKSHKWFSTSIFWI